MAVPLAAMNCGQHHTRAEGRGVTFTGGG
jgi:hypothetical protein